MQGGYLYAVARIRTNEKGLLSEDKLRRMAHTDRAGAMRILSESGYGTIHITDETDVEDVIASELERTYELIRELAPDSEVIRVFLMRRDVTALKTLIKRRCLGEPLERADVSGGAFSKSELAAMVAAGEYGPMPRAIADAARELELRLASKVDPRDISTSLDKAYYEYAASCRDAFVREYFAISADFQNIITMLRMKRNGENTERFEAYMLPAGRLTAAELKRCFNAPAEAMVSELPLGSTRDMLKQCVEEAVRTGSIGVIEKRRDDVLTELLKQYKWESDTVMPVLGYMLAREREAKNIRLVITLARNNFGEEAIDERLRELYV